MSVESTTVTSTFSVARSIPANSLPLGTLPFLYLSEIMSLKLSPANVLVLVFRAARSLALS